MVSLHFKIRVRQLSDDRRVCTHVSAWLKSPAWRPRCATFGRPGATRFSASRCRRSPNASSLRLALDYVREGDTFTVTKIDRLARSVGDLLAIVARLEAKKVSLRVLSISGNQPLDTATSTGRLMLA